jgi:hypothetical protein
LSPELFLNLFLELSLDLPLSGIEDEILGIIF